MRVALVHPDLGLGGAERLVIDIALAVQSNGHAPVLYTAHRDPARCFVDVHPASERVPVKVLWSFFPRNVFGRFHALLAALRCAVLALWVCLYGDCDVAIVDIVSLPVLIFAFFRIPVLFYCHFPDKTLEQTIRKGPSSRLRRAYRFIVDHIEQRALSHASCVVCNSAFTQQVFSNLFPTLPEPKIVYPCVQLEISEGGQLAADAARQKLHDNDSHYIVSLNRYERKKNIPLAIRAFRQVLEALDVTERSKLRLVVAGGFDPRLAENVQHFAELEELVVANSLQEHVELRRNISDGERRSLISSATALVYTPCDEHFGIVPLEAMALGTAVVAADSGGPMESVLDGETGFLRPPTPEAFAHALIHLIRNPMLAQEMGLHGRNRVAVKFSLRALSEAVERILQQCRRTANVTGNVRGVRE